MDVEAVADLVGDNYEPLVESHSLDKGLWVTLFRVHRITVTMRRKVHSRRGPRRNPFANLSRRWTIRVLPIR